MTTKIKTRVPTIEGPDYDGRYTTSCKAHAWGTYRSHSLQDCAEALFNHIVQFHSGEPVTYQAIDYQRGA